MKKTLLLSITAIFATILLFGLTSAAVTVTGTTTNLLQEDGSFLLTLHNNNLTDNETINLTIPYIGDISSKIEFNIESSGLNSKEITIQNNSNKIINVTYNIQNNFNFELGKSYKTDILINGTDKGDVSFENTYCGNTKNIENRLDVSNLEINTIDGFGDDERYWYLRDTVEISFDVDNRGSDINNMDVDWAIYNTNGRKVMDGSESIKDLDNGDDTTIRFQVKLDENMDDFDREDAVLYVKAFGNIDDRDSIYDNDKTCDSTSENVEVRTREDFVIADGFTINDKEVVDILDEKLTCGSEVTASAQIYNIGEDDQQDVYVEVYSKLLGLNKRIDIGDIDAYDSSNIDFSFTLPEELDTIKTYNIQYEVFDENNNVYENKEDDKAEFHIYFKIEGDCITVAPTVGAEVPTNVFSGSEMTIKTTIRNNEPNSVIYTLSATEFEGWADSVSVDPQVISLKAGESKEVNFNFKNKNDVEGNYSFNIVTMEGEKIVSTQIAAVTIEKKGFNLEGLTDKENLKLAGIIALNLIFVVLIIIVTRKILRRK